MSTYSTITAAELAERKDSIRLIDVREQQEWAIARIQGAVLLPLSQAQDWIGTLDPSEEIVVMCHHGIRSAQVCRHLAGESFDKVSNLDGGIDAWSREVDPAVPRY